MIYRFTVNEREMKPNYKQDISIEYSKEGGEQFYRAALSSPLKFMGKDFEFLDAHHFESEFRVLLEKSSDRGTTWQSYWTGEFYKTDGNWDHDNKIVEVKVSPRDEYTEILTGMDKEYNLIDLAPKIHSLEVDKRPLIQIYQLGSSSVGCFLGGNAWEQDVSSPVWNDDPDHEESIQKKFHFSKVEEFFQATLVESPYGAYPEGCLGNYSGPNLSRLLGPPGYYLDLVHRGGAWDIWDLHLRSLETDALILYGSATPSLSEKYPQDSQLDSLQVGGPNKFVVMKTFTSGSVYSRFLTSSPSIEGRTVLKLPSDDVLSNNRNYQYAMKYASSGVVRSDLVTSEPTKYGRREFEGSLPSNPAEYYLPPADIEGVFYPISRLNWAYYSFWFRFRESDAPLERQLRTTYSLPDAFMLSDAVELLANKIDPLTKYTVDEGAMGLGGRLMITPKSNITAGSYSLAAQRAPVKLKEILDAIKDTIRFYWFIEKGIEPNTATIVFRPLWWFKGQDISIDTTTLISPRSGLPWSFQSDKVSYDKLDMPSRYEFSWADDTSILFDGEPIDIRSKFVERDKVENVNIQKFNTDIDFMLLAPEKISPEGFALFQTVTVDGKRKIKYLIEPGAAYKELQNGEFSWYSLHEDMWCEDMPAERATVNGRMRIFDDQQRSPKKIQTVSFPLETEPDLKMLIKTNVGQGKIEKLSVYLHSRMAKAELRHDTYE